MQILSLPSCGAFNKEHSSIMLQKNVLYNKDVLAQGSNAIAQLLSINLLASTHHNYSW